MLAGGEVISGFFKPDANFEDSFLRVVSGKRLSLRFGNCSFMATETEIDKIGDNALVSQVAQIIHADGNPAYPEREPWQPMNFIR